MVASERITIAFAAVAAVFAFYLLAVLPWTRPAWQHVTPGYVIWIRACWAATVALAAASLIRWGALRRVSRILVAGFGGFTFFTLAVVFEQYFLW
jgi:hypothetical protein